MKRFIMVFVVLTMLCFAAGAESARLTDAPGTPTQDRAVALSASWQDEAKTPYDLQGLPADQETMDIAEAVYDFVYEQGHRPIRWFPEETQRAVEEMVDFDPDILNMTELTRIHAAEIDPPTDLDGVLSIDIAYQPGQLTVVILGCDDASGETVWTPVESKVTKVGRIEFTVPQELMASLQGRDVFLVVMTVHGDGSGDVIVEEFEIHIERPSKSADDVIRIRKVIGIDGTALPPDFSILPVPETEAIRNELAGIAEYLKDGTHSPLSWLPEGDQNRVRFLLGDDVEGLIISEYLCLTAVNYQPTYGDLIATINLAAPYGQDQKIVSVLGLPKQDAGSTEGTQMEWSVQPVIVREDGSVDIIFDQLAVIGMTKDTGLLLIFSEPVTGE